MKINENLRRILVGSGIILLEQQGLSAALIFQSNDLDLNVVHGVELEGNNLNPEWFDSGCTTNSNCKA